MRINWSGATIIKMGIKELKNNIMKIAERMNEGKDCEVTAELSLMRLTEEVGGLAGESFNRVARPERFSEEKLKDGICGTILETCLFAKLLDIDLSKELSRKIDELNVRVEA